MRRERKIAVKFLIVRLLLTFALFSHVIYRLRRIDKPVKTGWIIIPEPLPRHKWRGSIEHLKN